MAGFEPGKLIHQGTLIKSPPENKSKDLGRWKRRHFKLWSNKTLEYFKNEKSERPLRKPIDLTQCRSIDGNLKNKKWDNIFCLNTSYRQFFLVAESHDCMEKWIAKLCEICGFTVQAQGAMEWSSKVKVKPTPGSPTYSKGASSIGMEIEGQGSLSKDYTMDACGVSDNLPSYDKELPPIPDSSSENSDDLESTRLGFPHTAVGAPYTSGIKQPKSSVYSNAPSSLYDKVPAPRCVEEVILPSLNRRVSTPSESAEKNDEITDEPYVDMQPCDAKSVSRSNSLLGNQPSAYDVVPPPRPKDEADKRKYGHYDVVPSPASESDEYIPCEILTSVSPKEYLPPVPAQTYNGFDRLPSDETVGENSIYDVPPGGLSDHTALVSNLHITDSNSNSSSAMQSDSGSSDEPFWEGTNSQRLQYDGYHSSYGKPVGAHFEDPVIYDDPSLSHENQIDDLYDTPPPPRGNGRKEFHDTSLGPLQDSPQGLYDTPPVPSRNHGEGSDDASSQPCRQTMDEIYDTPPVPSRNHGEGSDDPSSQLCRHTMDEIYGTPPVPSRNCTEEFEDTSSDPYRQNLQEIYDTPPVPRRNDTKEFDDTSTDRHRQNQQEIYDTPPIPRRNDTKEFYDTSTDRHRQNQQEIYDTPPIPRRNDTKEFDGNLSDPYRYNLQDIYNTPPVPNRNDREGFSDTQPNAYHHNHQDISDSPPAPNRNDRQNVHDDPSDLYRFEQQDIYDTPPAPKQSGSQNLYDFPPTLRNSSTQETPDFPQFQNRRPDLTFEPGADSLYDIPPKSELCNPRSQTLYDFSPKSQRFARQDDIYDVPPMAQSQTMMQPYGTRKGDTTSPADLFNFGFNLSPPAVDRSLKYASTGGIETRSDMPPPIDRKTRPILATSVPIFPSDFQSGTFRDNQVVPDNLYQSSLSRHEGAQTRK